MQEINPQLTRLSQWLSGTPVKSNVDFIRRDFRQRRHHCAIGLITPIVESFQHCLIVIEVNKLTCGIFTLVFFLPSNNEISTSITPKRGSVVFHVCSSPIITWKCRNLFCVSMTKY